MYALIVLDRHLAPINPDERTPAPEEWWLSQVCESFQITPVAGGAASQPLGLTKIILALRSYRTAHDMITGAIPIEKEKIPSEAVVYVAEVKELRVLLDALEEEEAEQEEARAILDTPQTELVD